MGAADAACQRCSSMGGGAPALRRRACEAGGSGAQTSCSLPLLLLGLCPAALPLCGSSQPMQGDRGVRVSVQMPEPEAIAQAAGLELDLELKCLTKMDDCERALHAGRLHAWGPAWKSAVWRACFVTCSSGVTASRGRSLPREESTCSAAAGTYHCCHHHPPSHAPRDPGFHCLTVLPTRLPAGPLPRRRPGACSLPHLRPRAAALRVLRGSRRQPARLVRPLRQHRLAAPCAAGGGAGAVRAGGGTVDLPV